MRHIFILKYHTKKAVEKLASDPFQKKREWRISLDQHSKILYSLFLLYVQAKDYQSILKIRCQPCLELVFFPRI